MWPDLGHWAPRQVVFEGTRGRRPSNGRCEERWRRRGFVTRAPVVAHHAGSDRRGGARLTSSTAPVLERELPRREISFLRSGTGAHARAVALERARCRALAAPWICDARASRGAS